MRSVRSGSLQTAVILACLAPVLHSTFGGGSGLNVVVVVNQTSANSLALGNFYCEQRKIPPQNVLRISWTGGNAAWTSNDFHTVLKAPLMEMLTSRGLASQIDYVVLSMDIPFQTRTADSVNSTTSALFYGLKEHSGPSWRTITNSYAGSEAIFRYSRPASALGPSFLTTMLTARSLATAKALVVQGVNGDGSMPRQPVVLAKSSDPLRNFRYFAFDDAIFNTRLCHGSIVRTNSDSVLGQTNLLGYQTGLITFDISSGTFVPGAIADSLTSFGGVIFGPNDHTSLLAFIEAGAAGSYGTVSEPAPGIDKFPGPQDYFYQARGFNLAESYYQSIADPHEGLIVGEPLSAPYARPAAGQWLQPAAYSAVKDTVPLEMLFAAAGADRPVSQIDLFLDGKFLTTVTNLLPGPGNLATLFVNGYPVEYVVPEGASLSSVARGVAQAVNAASASVGLQVRALSVGDRIQLQSTATNGAPSFFVDQPRPGAGAQYYQAVYLAEAAPSFGALGPAENGGFALRLNSPVGTTCIIEATTDMKTWVPVLTNATGGVTELIDSDAMNYPSRFYRLAWQAVDVRPRLSMAWNPSFSGPHLHIETSTNLPYNIEASSDLISWKTLHTNPLGTSIDFIDPSSPKPPFRFYRTSTPLSPHPSPKETWVGLTSNGGSIIRVDGAEGPWVLMASSDLRAWTPVLTNLAAGIPSLGASTTKGSGESLSILLSTSGGSFLKSTAHGIQSCSVSGTVELGAWLALSVRLTNGTQLVVGVTNQSGNGKPIGLAGKLVEAFNARPELQGADGVVAEDVTEGWFGSAYFNLRARTGGLEAAGAAVRFEGAATLAERPGGDFMLLQSNLPDLQPRAHVLVRAGLGSLRAHYVWDTRQVEDGFHELTAVAYEGSHVLTQSRIALPVVVRNSALQANLIMPATSELRSAGAPMLCQVTVNTNAVVAIRLFSTGGMVGSATNQASAKFTVAGGSLGAGLHPFYAVVETRDGQRYRTQTRFVRLTP